MSDYKPEYQMNLGNSLNNKKEIVFFAVSLIFFIAILGVYIFFFLNRNSHQLKFVDEPRPDTEFYKIDPETKEITKAEEEPIEVVITDLELDEDIGGFRPEGIILKGYFDSLDQNSEVLKFKNRFSTISDNLQLLSLNISKIKDFYCWPAKMANSDVDIRNVEIGLSSPSSVVYHPEEKLINFDEINKLDMKDAFLIMQLDSEYDFDKTNFVKKLIVIDCKNL
ncbi:MAG: hypothetical protein ACOZAK_00685 [Patescibacteria group bacterium]